MKRRGMSGKAIWRCGTAAMLALAAASGIAPAASQTPQGAFNPPTAALVLTRSLSRGLPDGKIITTRRDYEVRITPAGGGYRVDGALVDVVVDAPPSLAGLAEIERRRPDAGLFPIYLDASGSIVSKREEVPGTAVGQAVTLVSQRIGSSGLAALDMLQAQAFVAQLRSHAAHSNWPSDVFRPALGRRSEVRRLELADANAGEVTIVLEGQGQGPAGQVAAIDRIVTTNMGGDRRVTRERWQISKAPAAIDR